jgi:arginine utilization protein RocB
MILRKHISSLKISANMDTNRNISINSGGTYNESIQVQGDFVQGNKITSHNFNQDILSIQNLLTQFKRIHDPEEAVKKTAQELATNAERNPEKKKRLIDLVKYLSSNGGTEAVIGKIAELALKLLIGI